jgi:telomerase reverse transcriptase
VSPNLTPLSDVFNRCADTSSWEQTTHIAKYIFPREFKLHNVFTSPVDPRETSQPLKDYTLREHEIAAAPAQTKVHLPKRIRGPPLELVHKIRKAHSKLPYVELLRYYCPDPVSSRAFCHEHADFDSQSLQIEDFLPDSLTKEALSCILSSIALSALPS